MFLTIAYTEFSMWGLQTLSIFFSFEKMVCEALKIELPQFVTETAGEAVFFAILSSRREIPNDLQMTASDVVSALKFNFG